MIASPQSASLKNGPRRAAAFATTTRGRWSTLPDRREAREPYRRAGGGRCRRLADRLRRRAENRSHERQVRLETLAAVGQATGAVLLGTVAGLMVLSQFADISPLLAGASVVGLAIGLGARSVIRDVIAGFFILLEDHFGVGDRVIVNDRYSGRVQHLDLRRTVLRNIQDGSVLTIPNGESRVVANTTKGWSQIAVDLRVDYTEDIDRVLAALDHLGDDLVADEVAGALLLDRPEVLGVEAFGESDVTLRVMLKTQPGQQAGVGRRYRALVKRAFDREGIALPNPQQVILASAEPSVGQRVALPSRGEVLA